MEKYGKVSKREELIEVFREGSKKAREIASSTMEEVRKAMNFLTE